MQKITVHIITEKLNLKNGGASIAITDNEQIQYQNCFGFSNIESNKNTRFNIASISKIFATVATMILVDE